MSNLTAEQWSEAATSNLRNYEQNCADNELFIVGYLIPLVERVEIAWPEDEQATPIWNERYLAYVSECIAEDALSEEDQNDVKRLLSLLKFS